MADDVWIVRRGDQWRADVEVPEWLDPAGATFEGEITWTGYGTGLQSLELTVDNGRLNLSEIADRSIRVSIEELDGARVPLGRLSRRVISMTKAGVVATFDSIEIEVCGTCVPSTVESFDVPQPNIVLIVTDDQDYQTISKSADFMPKLHQHLRQAGTYFPNAFSQFPLCTPARCSFLTGLSGHNHGVIANRLPTGGVEKFLPQEDNTVPLWMQEHGYTTGFAGKYLNGYGLSGRAQDSHNFPPGWDDWRGQIGQSYYGDGNGVTLCENGEPVDYEPTDYVVDVISEHAVNFVTTAVEPFYMQVCPVAPHSVAEFAVRHADLFTDETNFLNEPNFNPADVSNRPWHIRRLDPLTPEKVAEDRLEYINRLRALAAVDDMIEAIVNALTTRGIINNTVIVFMPDNGVAIGAHRVRSKGALYDAVTKVGLVMRGPGIPADVTVESMVDTVDVVATILDFAQVTPFDVQDLQRPLDGASFRALLADPEALWKTEQFFEVFPANDAEDEDGLILVDREHAFGLRTAERLYTEYFSSDYGRERELYDLTLDPWQMDNLVDVTTDKLTDTDYAADLNELQVSLANRVSPIIYVGATQPPLPRGLYDILLQLGLVFAVEDTNPDCMFVLDFGSKLCTKLAVDTHRVVDLKADQPVHSWHLGGGGSLNSEDPTPHGEAGGMSREEYYEFDGTQFFTRVGATNTAEIESLHKDGALLTAVGMIWIDNLAASHGVFGTNGGDLDSIGVGLSIPTTGLLRFRASNGSGVAALSVTSTAALIAGRWNFFAVSIDEAANVSRFNINGVASISTGTYASPSAANASFLMELASLGNDATTPLRAGDRLAQLAMFTSAMSADELEAIWQRSRVRFGI